MANTHKYLVIPGYCWALLMDYPSAGPRYNVKAMRNQHWGKQAKIVRCGNYIYNVPEEVFEELLKRYG